MMNWKLAKLESLCDVFTDGDWIESKNQSVEGVRLIQTGNVGEGEFKNRRDKSRFISEYTFNKLKCCEIFEGDCLVSRLPDPVGRSCILPEVSDRMITAVDCTILRFKKEQLIPEFFNYFTQSRAYLDKVESLTSGATRKRISRKNLGLVELPLPPIPEQKRIVAILDQAFADIEQARAKTVQNLKNARELFESYLQQVFSQRGEGWVEESMDSACNLITCGVAATPKYVDESIGVPFLSAQNVNKGQIRLHKFRYITQELHSHLTKKNKPRQGDILYSRVGAGFGEAAVVERSFEFSVYVSVTLIKPKPEKLNNYFLKYYLNSPQIKALARASITSSGVPNLNVKTVRQFKVAFPSMKKQEEIVTRIKLVETQAIELQVIYEKKLAELNELKKSILQKAFSGELTKAESKGAAA